MSQHQPSAMQSGDTSQLETALWDIEYFFDDIGRLGERLWVVSIAFFVVFLTAVINSFLPMKLLDPSWQQAMVANLINFGGFPLLGLVLVHIAAVFAPSDRRLQARRNLLSRVAILACFGYILLIPLLAQAVWLDTTQTKTQVQQQSQQDQEKLKDLKEAVSTASTGQELRERLTAMKGPTLTDVDLQRPLPELKQQLIAAFQLAASQAAAQRARQVPATPRILIGEVVRVGVGCLALALGFASLSQRRGVSISLLQEWQSRWYRRQQEPLVRKNQQLDQDRSFVDELMEPEER